MGAFGSANASRAAAISQKADLNFKAAIADINAQLDERSAQQELLKGQQQEQSIMLKGAATKSSARVAMAANGIELNVGTAQNIQDSIDTMSDIDVATAHSNALSAAFGYRTQAINNTAQAEFSRASAGAIDPDRAYTTSLIAGAGQVASSWYTMNKAGLPMPSMSKPGDGDPRYPVRGSRSY